VLAVGFGGAIVRSGDDGESWALVRRDSLGPELLGVHCGEGGDAFAVGRDGLLLRSRNRGLTWAALPGPSSRSLTRILFADSLRGLITTENGTVLSTSDGARTWKASLLDSALFLRGLAWQGQEAIVTGSDGGLWSSRDNGATWSRAAPATPFFLQAAGFTGSGAAVAVGDGGVILRRPEGTAPWEPCHIGVSGDLTGLALIAPRKWLAFGTDGLLVKTVDEGRSWSVKGTGSAHYLSAAFHGGNGAATTAEGALFHSRDEGETWQPSLTPKPPESGLIFGVDFADSATAVAVGDEGCAWRSVDAGRTWTALTGIPVLGRIGLNAIEFHPDGSGIIVGDSGTILATTDRGAAWRRIPAPAAVDLFGLAFRDPRTGMAVGRDGTVLWTRDGGLSWAPGPLENGNMLVYAAWLGGDTALVHGLDGHITVVWLTPDRGKTWTKIPQLTRLNLWAMKSLGSGKVAFLGEKGAIVIRSLNSEAFIPQGPGTQPFRGSFSVQRTGIGPRALFTLPRTTRFRISILTPTGQSLGRILRGVLPAGRHSLVLPLKKVPGPLVYILESEDGSPLFRYSSLLPF
jgi:photosystem II stability/assembly factor-like uncharacterized protein